jgi:hypothetical protein
MSEEVSPRRRSSKRKTLAEQRTPSVFPHHSRSCPAKGWDDVTVICTCSPTFQPQVWDTKTKRPVKGPKCSTIAEAKSWLVDARHDKKRGKLRTPTGQTFNELADEFLAGMRDGTIRNRNKQPYKPSTIRSYEAALDNRLRPEFGTLKPEIIGHLDFQDYVDELVAEGLEGQTVKNIIIPAMAIYKRAAKRQGIVNVTRDLDLPESDGKRDVIAAPSDVPKLIDALDDAADRAAWALMFYAGLRWGEVQGLLRKYAGTDVIEVAHSWDKEEGLGDPKSKAGKRIIPVCAHLGVYL